MRKKNIKKRVIIYAILSAIILSVAANVFILDNPDILCLIAEGLDDPSSSYYFVIDRIYKISTSKGVEEKFLRYLKENKNKNLHSQYIRILGGIGDVKASPVLKQYYIKNQHNRAKKIELYFAIKSMGLTGNKDIQIFLTNLLQNSGESNMPVDASTISAALYLITGENNYDFVNSVGKKQKLRLTKGLIDARKIIVSSKNRKRTAKEMITTDKIFRPPGSRWGHTI